ncbi:hypothetical protein PtrM4_076590 [Pyrenophora tritici-repentis]|uniref:DDE-1 domain-containing protein n=1 Tax=Pyrenophora tritici-repentis TaxID=45151 RepID=A0A834VS72_9PLEO|nr:hypothetical protein PtrM4_076590 [Pyrenophora tritici-repentis]
MALRSAPQLASNEADIQLAISSINAHQINSASTAAAIYNVPRTTPRNRRAGIPARRDCQPNSRKLTQREEEVIISHILHLDLRGFGPTYVDVRDMADKLMAARGASLVSIHWPRNFVKRTDSLRTCFNRAYDRQRALCENSALIQRWFKLVEETKTELSICDEDTYNFDEAGFIIGKITTQLVITGLERRGRPKSIQLGNREWVTLIAAISAAWYKEDILRDWAIAVSDNGWTNNELGVEWLKHFNAHTQARSIGARRLLIIDGHRSHQSLEF